MNTKEKRQIFARSILDLGKKGNICNDSAKDLIEKETSSKPTNMEILKRISDSFYELSALTQEEIAVLTYILDRHNLLNVPPLDNQNEISNVDAKKNKISLLNGLLKITDLSPVEQSKQDEYDYILRSTPAKHIYFIELEEHKDDFTIKFSNYIYGNLCIDKNDIMYREKSLVSLCSRKNVVTSLLNNYGFISENVTAKCSYKQQKEMLLKLIKTQPNFLIRRADDSKIAVLKVGSVSVSKNDKITEKLDQYLIFTNSRYYLSYGKINFNLARISSQYKYSVANILLSYNNLNSSRYIGSLISDKIVKSNVPFEKPAIYEVN